MNEKSEDVAKVDEISEDINDSLIEPQTKNEGEFIHTMKKYQSKRCYWCKFNFIRQKESDIHWKEKRFCSKYCEKRLNEVKKLFEKNQLNRFFIKEYNRTRIRKRCFMCGTKIKINRGWRKQVVIKKFDGKVCQNRFNTLKIKRFDKDYLDSYFNYKKV